MILHSSDTVCLTCTDLGHKLAWEVAGVLHRDISIGNILTTDEASADGSHGFIHYFDYSSVSAVPPGEVNVEVSSEDRDEDRKERTVCYIQQLLDGF